MSHFLRHEPCPKCGSRDNLGVWEDGHKWCFGCHYHFPTGNNLNLDTIRTRISLDEHTNKNNIYLPHDFDYYIPNEPLAWLNKYGISQVEREVNRIGYSEELKFLIFPLFTESGELEAWQARDFSNTSKSRYFTRGDVSNVLHILGHGNVLVLTEDILSAIKVARITASMPIFGSHIQNKSIVRLSRYFKSLLIWLDHDKAKEAIKASNRAKLFFDVAEVVVTEKDPKEYTTGEIKRIINYDRFDNSKITS